MNELFEVVKVNVGEFLSNSGYAKKGKNDFIKKEKLHKREELISFSSVRRRASNNQNTFIAVTSGIYYKEVNQLEKKIVQDFLNSYPIVAGSIGHFKESKSGYISIPIVDSSQIEKVSTELIEQIKLGAFNLFNRYSTLQAICLAVEKKEDWVKDYHKFLDFRSSIRLAAMFCLTKGKQESISWFKNNALKDPEKIKFTKLMEKEW